MIRTVTVQLGVNQTWIGEPIQGNWIALTGAEKTRVRVGVLVEIGPEAFFHWIRTLTLSDPEVLLVPIFGYQRRPVLRFWPGPIPYPEPLLDITCDFLE